MFCTVFAILMASMLEMVLGMVVSLSSYYVFGYDLEYRLFVNGKGSKAISSFFNEVGKYSGLNECGVGFSGVTFSYLTILSVGDFQSTQSLFGLIQVPSRLYPWILLLVTEVMLPGSSFMGHLMGILTGYLFVYLFEKNQKISSTYEQAMEKLENRLPSFIKNMECYVGNSSQKLYTGSGGFLSHLMENGQLNSGSPPSDYWGRIQGNGRSLGY